MEFKVTRSEAYKILKALNLYHQMYKDDEASVLLSRLLDDYRKQAYYDHMNRSKL